MARGLVVARGELFGLVPFMLRERALSLGLLVEMASLLWGDVEEERVCNQLVVLSQSRDRG